MPSNLIEQFVASRRAADVDAALARIAASGNIRHARYRSDETEGGMEPRWQLRELTVTHPFEERKEEMMKNPCRLNITARLTAVGLLACSLFVFAGSAPASAAPECKREPCVSTTVAADLTVGVTASPNPVAVSGTHTYTLTVTNTTWAWNAYQAPHPVAGPSLTDVRVHLNSFPSDEILLGARDDTGTGFICYTPPEFFGMDVRCIGGTVPSGSSARITLTMRAPTKPGAFSATATVDPYGQIVEYSESNNTAAVSFSAI